MSGQRRDGAERLLGVATAGLPARHSQWGAAMRAELAAIDDPDARRQFARSAAAVAFRHGIGIPIGLGLVAALLTATVTVTASRLQLADGGPGVMNTTVPIPALLLLLVSLVSTGLSRSVRIGLETGIVGFAASFAALLTVLAVEGTAWMDRHGVFLLDGDPPRGDVDSADVAFDILHTGIWVGHVVMWIAGILIGALLGAWISGWRGEAGNQTLIVESQER